MGEATGTSTTERLWSLDALRGLDMMMITGLSGFVTAVCQLSGVGGEWMSVQMTHAKWEGVRIMDMVFPLFLFIAGVSFPFACAKYREKGRTTGWIVRKCLFRACALAALGIAIGGFFKLNFAHLRVWSVLGRIGFAWMVAALLFLKAGRVSRLLVAFGLLLVTWLVMRFLSAPDAQTLAYPDCLRHLSSLGNGPFTPVGDFGCWLDRTLTAGHTYRPIFDPEGFSGFLPAVVTAMLGMFAGEFVREGRSSGNRKTLVLAGTGVLSVLGGLGLSVAGVCPMVKALWTPAFVLYVGGWSFLVFALFYWVIDVKQCRRWTFVLRVVGMNSITIYVAQRILPFRTIEDFFFKGLLDLVTPAAWHLFFDALAYMTVCWLFLYFLYRKNVFLKV